MPSQKCNFMDNLIKEDIPRAKMFHGTFRFVDDLCALTDGENFQTSYKEIYPKGLVLKLEHSGYHAAFLDLNIAISNGKISTTLYDKHEDFFFVCMPNFHSNIPSSVFYGTVICDA